MKKTTWKLIGTIIANLALGVLGNWFYEVAKSANWSSPWVLSLAFYGFLIALQIGVAILIRNIVRNATLEVVEAFSRGMHEFIHRARDLFVVLLSDRSVIDATERPGFMATAHEHLIEKLLDVMASTFSLLVPRNTRVFTAIRERRADEHYHTFLRGGPHRADRGDTTEAVSNDSPMVQELTKAYNDKQDCVILTGPGQANWKEMHNDRHGEDRTVLMGAVFSKVWETSIRSFPRDKRKLEWILCVAADRPGVFNRERHFELMKCFNDIFAIFLNWFVREKPERISEAPNQALPRPASRK